MEPKPLSPVIINPSHHHCFLHEYILCSSGTPQWQGLAGVNWMKTMAICLFLPSLLVFSSGDSHVIQRYFHTWCPSLCNQSKWLSSNFSQISNSFLSNPLASFTSHWLLTIVPQNSHFYLFLHLWKVGTSLKLCSLRWFSFISKNRPTQNKPWYFYPSGQPI